MPEVAETELPEADLPEDRDRVPAEPVLRVSVPPEETLPVSETLPFEADREVVLPAVIAPTVRLPEPAVAETEDPLATTVPETDETFMLAASEPPFMLSVLFAESEPPLTDTAPLVVALNWMLAPPALAFSEAPLPRVTLRAPPPALLCIDRLPEFAVSVPFILSVPEVAEIVLPEAVFPLDNEMAPAEPLARVSAPPVAETLSVSERFPFDAVKETAPPVEETAPIVRLPLPAVIESELPDAVTVPDTEVTFMVDAPVPPVKLTELLAESEPPLTDAPEVELN